ncbi:MAG: ComEC family competence protein [candidate division Zixibacteria bacterium]|nr:ComEC family competence protein [candidate division Zixibacteria bacterium]
MKSVQPHCGLSLMIKEWHVAGRNSGLPEDRKRITVRGSRHPALLLAVFVALGVCIADQVTAGPTLWLSIALVAFPGVVALLWVNRWRGMLLLAGVLLAIALGAWRMSVDLHGRPSLPLIDLIEEREPVEIYGRLTGIPRQRLSGWSAPIEVMAVRTDAGIVPLQSAALLSTHTSLSEFRHGDQLHLTGRFEAPFVRRNPGGFDYAAHLFRQGIDAVVRPVDSLIDRCGVNPAPSLLNLVEPVRAWLRSVFSVHMPKTARALILGFLLGDTDQLSPGIVAAFRDSGTLHLLAVSGANVWLLVGLVAWPMRLLRIPRWPRSLILLSVVAAFCVLTRNEPSVVRASLVVAFFITGRLIYRPVGLLNAVGASALVILIGSPSQLFRPGFQLSYAAVIGIAVVARQITPWVQSLKARWLRSAVLIVFSSVAATLATAPIVAWHFGTVSLVSLFANLAMIPLAAVSLYLCLALAFLSVLSAAVASWLAFPAARLLDLSAYLATAFSKLPGAHIPWPNPSPVWIVHLYVAGFLALNWRHRYRWVRPVTWYSVGLVVMLLASSTFHEDPPQITLAYLDTGNTRVAACINPNGDLTWLADDPGIDDQLEQWVTLPFIRALSVPVRHEETHSWRRTDSVAKPTVRSASAHGRFSPPGWLRYVSNLDSTADSRRIWCDRFTWQGDTVICLRDYPTSPPGMAWFDSTFGSGCTIVLPARTPDRLVRRILDLHAPRRVAFFGHAGGWRDPNQFLELWRMRYPDTEFYSTAVHGCIQINLGRAGASILPTMTESRWIPSPAG